MFQIAQPDAGGQDVHLPAGIVHIVFPVNPVADRLQQIGDGGAEGRAATVADVQRAGRVGGDEFHLHPLATTELASAKGVAALEDFVDHRVIGGWRQEEVDETGAGDLHLGDMVGIRQGIDDPLGQFTRLAAGGFGQDQRDGAGEIAVRPVAGAFQRDVRRRGVGQQILPPQAQESLGDECVQMRFQGKAFGRGLPIN